MTDSNDVRYEVHHGQDGVPPQDIIFGVSTAMRTIREMADKFASIEAPILITGETGTGKEVLAKYLHGKSPWADRPFFKLSCPLFRFSPVEEDPLSEAIVDMISTTTSGQEEAQPPLHGTLLLDDIPYIDMVLQVRLLEKLNENPLLQIQLPNARILQLRLICTANRSLEMLVREGHFLRELYHLIRVFTLDLPPLRQRREDLPRLTSYFLEVYSRKFGSPRIPPSPITFQRMSEYDWPGNLRELENLMMRYVVQGSEELFDRELKGHNASLSSQRALSRGASGS